MVNVYFFQVIKCTSNSVHIVHIKCTPCKPLGLFLSASGFSTVLLLFLLISIQASWWYDKNKYFLHSSSTSIFIILFNMLYKEIEGKYSVKH